MVNTLTTTLGGWAALGTAAGLLAGSGTAQTHGHPDLNGLTTSLLEDPTTEKMKSLHAIINGGRHIADTRLAFERSLFDSKPFDLKSKKAVDHLKRLETRFDRFRKDPKDISTDEKEKCVEHATDAFGFDLSDPQVSDWLNLVYDLIQLRQFLKTSFKKTLRDFDGIYPDLLTHFLCRERGENPVDGSCHLMATLAAHLGKRIGLPLQVYYSEGHVDLFVNKGKGLIYGSIVDSPLFFPRNFYSYFLLAPEKTDPQDFTFLVFSLTNKILDEKMATIKGASSLYNLGIEMGEVIEDAHWTYSNYMMYLAIKAKKKDSVEYFFENSLDHYPENFIALWLYFAFLFEKLGQFEEAGKILEKIESLIKRRQELGSIAEVEPMILQRLAVSRRQVDRFLSNGIKNRTQITASLKLG